MYSFHNTLFSLKFGSPEAEKLTILHFHSQKRCDNANHGRLQEIFLGGVDINSFRFLQVLHELIYGRYFITQHGLHFVQRIELAPESRNFSTSTLSIIPQEKCIRLKPSYLV